MVTLTLDQRDLSVWEDHANTWVSPRGRYRLMVGSSSRDIRSTSTLRAPGLITEPHSNAAEKLVADLVRVWITAAEAMSVPGFGARGGPRSRCRCGPNSASAPSSARRP